MQSALRIGAGAIYMAVATAVQAAILVPMLPWRRARIQACNHWGHLTCRVIWKLSGSTYTITGGEHLQGRALFVSNHTSILDIFLGMGISPVGTVGVAKKEVVLYPFLGQLYLLSGHLRVDRGNHERAMASMRELERLVDGHGLSIWMWPEGTRSKDGRLRPFKKGIWHLAVQTGLPVVPVVVKGAHKAWRKGSLALHPVDVDVEVLPPIDTSAWGDRPIDDVLDDLHATFADHLPADQQP